MYFGIVVFVSGMALGMFLGILLMAAWIAGQESAAKKTEAQKQKDDIRSKIVQGMIQAPEPIDFSAGIRKSFPN